MKKRLLSILLVLSMLMSLVLTTAVGAKDASAQLPFTDVKDSAWYAEAVGYVY